MLDDREASRESTGMAARRASSRSASSVVQAFWAFLPPAETLSDESRRIWCYRPGCCLSLQVVSRRYAREMESIRQARNLYSRVQECSQKALSLSQCLTRPPHNPAGLVCVAPWTLSTVKGGEAAALPAAAFASAAASGAEALLAVALARLLLQTHMQGHSARQYGSTNHIQYAFHALLCPVVSK
jgi:hypothetical protein